MTTGYSTTESRARRPTRRDSRQSPARCTPRACVLTQQAKRRCGGSAPSRLRAGLAVTRRANPGRPSTASTLAPSRRLRRRWRAHTCRDTVAKRRSQRRCRLAPAPSSSPARPASRSCSGRDSRTRTGRQHGPRSSKEKSGKIWEIGKNPSNSLCGERRPIQLNTQ